MRMVPSNYAKKPVISHRFQQKVADCKQDSGPSKQTCIAEAAVIGISIQEDDAC